MFYVALWQYCHSAQGIRRNTKVQGLVKGNDLSRAVEEACAFGLSECLFFMTHTQSSPLGSLSLQGT